MAIRVSLFSNIVTLCMNSDGDKLYMKLVAFDEIYNFVLIFSFEVVLGLKKGYIVQISIIGIQI
jgi:hypothetical protein